MSFLDKMLEDKFIITIIFIFIILIFFLEKHKLPIILNDLFDWRFISFSLLTFVFSFYLYFLKATSRSKEAVREALIAFTIAYLSRVDLVFPVFYLIFFYIYYIRPSNILE